jgi:hypothetical protein
MGLQLESILSELKNTVRWLKTSLSTFLAGASESIKKYLAENKQVAIRFAAYIVSYGLMINMSLFFIFGAPIWIGSIIGYGIIWYFIRQEIPSFISGVRRA